MNKDKDIYYIECTDDLSKEMLISLTNFYMPLIGKDAISLYLSLYSDSIYTNFNPLNKLFFSLGVYENTFNEALGNLEEYNLVNTYVKQKEDKDAYIFVINMPKSTYDFCKDDIYSRLLVKRLGKVNYQIVRSIVNPIINKKEFKEITKAFDVTKTIDYSQYDDEMYKMYNPKVTDEKQNKGFDIKAFCEMCDDFTYPFKARTLENNAIIKKYADMYAVSYDDMKKIVMNSSDNMPHPINGETIYFSPNKFYNQMSKYTPKIINNTEEPYKMLPMHYLQTQQQDGKIPYEERTVVDYLTNELKFSNEVANCVIEFALNNNNNKLTKGYIISIASPLKKFNVKSYLEAKDKLKQIVSSKTFKDFKPTFEKPVYKKNDIVLSEESQKLYDELLKGDK